MNDFWVVERFNTIIIVHSSQQRLGKAVRLTSNARQAFASWCRGRKWNKGTCHVCKEYRFDPVRIGVGEIYSITQQEIEDTAPVIKIN